MMPRYLVMFLFLPILALASTPIDDAKEMGRLHKNDSALILGEIHKNNNKSLKNLFTNFSENPSETKFYKGSLQTSTTLKEEAVTVASKSTIAKDIQLSNKNKEEVEKNNQVWLDKSQQNAKVIAATALSNVDSINKNLIDCSKDRICKTEKIQKQCENNTSTKLKHCSKKLAIDVIPHSTERHLPIRVWVKMHEKNHNYAGLKIDLARGVITWKQPKEGAFSLKGNVPRSIPCQKIVGRWRIVKANSTRTTIDNIRYPSCDDLTMDMHINSNRKLDVEIEIDLALVNTSQEFKDRWEDSCQSLEVYQKCKKVSENCVTENETHIISDTPIQRACWEKELAYQCGNATHENLCLPLIKEGCQLISSTCKDKISNDSISCQNLLETYTCNLITCMDTNIICNPLTYCDGNDCGTTGRKPDPDFGSAVSKLSASFESGNSFNEAHIFSGKSLECNKYALNSVNCCTDKGWLYEASNLFQCGKEAIELGKAREKGQASYIGHYKETANLKDINVFCVFPTKLARIVQEQGRNQQLQISFGSAKRPDCRGLTPSELQKIDFGKIDFHDFIVDLNSKLKKFDEKIINKKIQDKMRAMTKAGHAHD